MKKQAISLLIVVLGSLYGLCYGMATEHIGPLKSDEGFQLRGHNGMPVGIDKLHEHPSRVYSQWCNGREDVYYQADVSSANELLAAFSKLSLDKHFCLIDLEAEGLACTFGQQDIRYNLKLTIPEGIFLTKASLHGGDLVYYPKEIQVTLTGNGWTDLVKQLTIPVNITIVNKEAYSKDMAKPIADGNAAFAFDLYTQLRQQNGNLFFSPYSISTAMAMTYAGAHNKTAEQMAQTLHFNLPEEQFHKQYLFLAEQLNRQGYKGDYELSTANALWLQQDYHFLQDFRLRASFCYDASLKEVNFVKETEASRLQINQWVEDKTQEKIKDLIPAGMLDEATRLVLTNAIYFKGDWALQFDATLTKDEPFYITPEKTVTAALMHQQDDFKYAQTDALQILELPYKGEDLSMLVLLPTEKNKLADLENELTAGNLNEWQKILRKKEVSVYVPKFTMTCRYDLAKTLADMGMPLAFTMAADFSGMTGGKDLFISDVVHKAFVEVNEEGTEAAAATGVMMKLTAMPTPPPVFRADRPFVFIIKDNHTGSILFVGRMADPTKENK